MSSEQALIFGIPVQIANLVFNLITAICALSISFALLRNSIKPKIGIRMISKNILSCDTKAELIFCVENKGYWFAKPVVVELKIYCNFDKDFSLSELRYGSRLEKNDSDVKLGKEELQYFVADGIDLGSGKVGENLKVVLYTPKNTGTYKAVFDAYSFNGVSYRKSFKIKCKENSEEETKDL